MPFQSPKDDARIERIQKRVVSAYEAQHRHVKRHANSQQSGPRVETPGHSAAAVCPAGCEAFTYALKN